MDLTIVIPTLNSMPAVRMTLESLRPLRENGAEIIVVDSFSTDGTLEVCREFTDHILPYPKGNMYAAINAGLEIAATEWVGYLNSDDLVYSDSIIKAINTLGDESDLIYGNLDFIDSHGRFLHSFIMPPPEDIIPLACFAITSIPPQGTVFRRTLYKALQGFDTHFRLAGDFDFFIRAVLKDFRITQLKFPTIAAFRLHQNQLSQKHTSAHFREGAESVTRNHIHAGIFKRCFALARFKYRNFFSYVERIIRSRQLRGSWRILGSMYEK